MKRDTVVDRWGDLASKLRSLMAQVTDERLLECYKKLYAEGWDQLTFPLSTRNVDQEVKHAVFQAIMVEVVERRKGE